MFTALHCLVYFAVAVLLMLVVGIGCVLLARPTAAALRRKGPWGWRMMLGLGMVGATFAAQKERFVDASVAQGGNGLSWETAAKTIKEITDRIGYGELTIYVKPGVYEPFGFSDNLTFPLVLIAEDGPENTIIEGTADHPGGMYTFSGQLTYFETILSVHGFTLRNMNYVAAFANLYDCICVSNRSIVIDCGSMVNCLVTGTRAEWSPNGVSIGSDLRNCTIVDNEVPAIYDSYGSRANICNCIFYRNGGSPEDEVDPRFVDPAHGNYRLRPDSPYVDAGDNGGIGSLRDLDGNWRVQNGYVDMGCYESTPVATPRRDTGGVAVSFAWLENFGLVSPGAGWQDYVQAANQPSANRHLSRQVMNPDTGEMERAPYTVWESFVADLNPTNADETFRAEIAVTNGVVQVTPSPNSPNRRYTLHGKPTLAGGWAIASSPDDAEFMSTNRFFKVSVEMP